MALTENDLVAPTGRIPLSPFEPEASDYATSAAKRTAYVAAWLAEAVAKTTDEDAQQKWVYYRYFDWRCQALRETARVAFRGQGSISYDPAFVRSVCQEAARYETAFEDQATAKGAYPPIRSLR